MKNSSAAVNGNSYHATHLRLAELAAAGEDTLSFEPAWTFLESVGSPLRSSARKRSAAWTVAACVGTKETRFHCCQSRAQMFTQSKMERASQTGDLHKGIVLKKNNPKTKQGSRGPGSQSGCEVKLLTFPHPVDFFPRAFPKDNVSKLSFQLIFSP